MALIVAIVRRGARCPTPDPARPSRRVARHRQRRPLALRAGDGALGMRTKLEVKVLYESLLEEIVSRRQLHEDERTATPLAPKFGRRGGVDDPGSYAWQLASVRSCGMEALDEPQHRTKVKLRKAFEVWVSVPSYVTPDIQSRPRGSGDGRSGTLRVLTQGELPGSRTVWRVERRRRLERDVRDRGDKACSHDIRVGGKKATTTHRCLGNEREKSDHPITVRKPGNSGGAKGVTT